VSAHSHAHPHGGHGHSHGLVDASIKRSRAGLRAVGLALLILGLTAVVQTIVFAASGSVALLADLIHNFGDAATAIPLAVAFALRSTRAERVAGLFVVLAIFVSACVAGYEAIVRLVDPREPEHLGALAAAGAIGFIGNWLAAGVRSRAGRRLDSPALVADGAHARADAYVSLAVVASAAVVALGFEIADPLIGVGITLVILRITWDSWKTIRGGHMHDHHEHDQLASVIPPSRTRRSAPRV
jgi:cation diffusion facilitator family transporter